MDEVRESWLAMVNGWDPVRRRSCGGAKGKTRRGKWDREGGEPRRGDCLGCAVPDTVSLSMMRRMWPSRAAASD